MSTLQTGEMEFAEKWVDEVIPKERPITAQDVLKIWNSIADPQENHMKLNDFIKCASSELKKSIVLMALKGFVHSDIKQFTKIVPEKTGKKIRVALNAPY